jgi:hypothetical protein
MWIMVAGPYRTDAASAEDRARNLRTLNLAAYEIFKKGHIPVIGVNLALPIIEAAGVGSYEELMMPMSLAAASRCDGILKIGGECRGADLEVERVRRNGGIVFRGLEEIPDANEQVV